MIPLLMASNCNEATTTGYNYSCQINCTGGGFSLIGLDTSITITGATVDFRGSYSIYGNFSNSPKVNTYDIQVDPPQACKGDGLQWYLLYNLSC